MRHHTLTACHPSGGGGGSYTGPLDLTATPAVVAYGQRALSAAMLGQPLYRLRRDSDDAEMTFSSDAVTGAAPVAAITAWLGAANGFVKTWFDQSGNGSNAAQATAANQPQWQASATNSRPALFFPDTFDRLLKTAGNVTIGEAFTTFAVCRITSSSPAGGRYLCAINALDPSGPGYAIFCQVANDTGAIATDNFEDANSNESGGFTAGGVTPDAYCLIDIGNQFGNSSIFVDNVSIAFSGSYDNGGAPSGVSLPLAVGSVDVNGVAASTNWTGQVLEIINFGEIVSDADRTAIRANDKAWYGTP